MELTSNLHQEIRALKRVFTSSSHSQPDVLEAFDTHISEEERIHLSDALSSQAPPPYNALLHDPHCAERTDEACSFLCYRYEPCVYMLLSHAEVREQSRTVQKR